MYKSDVRTVFKKLFLISGGTIAGLLEAVAEANRDIGPVLANLASNNNQLIATAPAEFAKALKPIKQRIAGISPSGTAVELHEYGIKFDSVMAEFPMLEPVLRPGRQALAAFAGAYDVVLQKNQAPQAMTGLLLPGAALKTCLDHYAGLYSFFDKEFAEKPGEETKTIEFDTNGDLSRFSGLIGILATLAAAASAALAQGDDSPNIDTEITIVSIESGSPIQVVFQGTDKTLRLFLGMLRDIVRVPYLYLTKQGRLLQAMETMAVAKSLCIDDPETLNNIAVAMQGASRVYAEKFGDVQPTVKVDGEIVDSSLVYHSLQVDISPEIGPDEGRKLLGPPD